MPSAMLWVILKMRSEVTKSVPDHNPLFVAVPIALLYGFALVVKFLAGAEPDFKLGAPLIIKVKTNRHQRCSFAG